MRFATRLVAFRGRPASLPSLPRHSLVLFRRSLTSHSFIEPVWPENQQNEESSSSTLLRDLALKSASDLGELAEHGKSLLRDVIDESRAKNGSRHPSTLTALGRYITILQQEGQFEEAEPLCYEVEATTRELLGDFHESTLVATRSLAAVLLSQGKLTDAEPVIRREFEASRTIHGDADDDVLLSLCTLIDCMASGRKWAEAEPLAKEEYAWTVRAYGRPHPRTLRSAMRLASVLGALGKEEQAAAVRNEATLAAAPMFTQPDRSSTWSQWGGSSQE